MDALGADLVRLVQRRDLVEYRLQCCCGRFLRFLLIGPLTRGRALLSRK